MSIIAPSEHTSLWLVGPDRLRNFNLWFAENPTYARLGGIAELGFGVWLALRQYKGLEHEPVEEPPVAWYRRWFRG